MNSVTIIHVGEFIANALPKKLSLFGDPDF